MPQEKLNDLAKKHGRNSIITMLLFALGMIGLLAGMFMNNVYVRYAALACIAASIIIAFVLVDTAERRYFDAFEDLYMREEFTILTTTEKTASRARRLRTWAS